MGLKLSVPYLLPFAPRNSESREQKGEENGKENRGKGRRIGGRKKGREEKEGLQSWQMDFLPSAHLFLPSPSLASFMSWF